MINLIYRFFLIFCFSGGMGYSNEILDVETLPCSRTKQYSLAPYRKIVVFSAPRTGSSLVYNVLRFLFEHETRLSSSHNEFNQDCFVLKTHRFNELEMICEKNVLYVVTIRNPVHAIASNYRISPRPIANVQEFARKLLHKHREYLVFSEAMKEAGGNVVFIKYEDIDDNLDCLFDFIETLFLVPIATADRELMKKGYERGNVYSLTQGFYDFKDYLPLSGFHGKHVTLEKYTPPEELQYWLNHYLPDAKPVFQKYGYFTD
jgi:hypothetical protein